MQSSPWLFTGFQVPLSSPGSLITQLFPRRGHCGDFGAACDQSQRRQGAGCWLLAPTDARAVRNGGTRSWAPRTQKLRPLFAGNLHLFYIITAAPPPPLPPYVRALDSPNPHAVRAKVVPIAFVAKRVGVGMGGGGGGGRSVKGSQCSENNRKQKDPNKQKVKNADFNRTTQNAQINVRRKPD